MLLASRTKPPHREFYHRLTTDVFRILESSAIPPGPSCYLLFNFSEALASLRSYPTRKGAEKVREKKFKILRVALDPDAPRVPLKVELF